MARVLLSSAVLELHAVYEVVVAPNARRNHSFKRDSPRDSIVCAILRAKQFRIQALKSVVEERV